MAETMRNLYDGVPMDEVRKCVVLAARTLIEKDPAYSYVTARLLLDNGVAQSTLDEEARSASERIAAAAALAEAAPCPDPGELFTDVQDAGAPSWP